MIVAASKKIPVFFSYNMSLGIAALSELAKKAASLMKDAEIEIVEIHHDQKLDAPSGTALLLADSIKEVRPDSNLVIGRNGHAKREKNDIGISSIRIGNVVGVHEIIISSGLETLTLKHEAHDRSLFADGALVAAEYLSKVNQPGLYNMKDLVK
jgi:4-hydroxy-tetrahydrodipicolinate reductase